MNHTNTKACIEWAKRMEEALIDAKKIAAEGGAYGLAQYLHNAASAFSKVIGDDEKVAVLAAAADVVRRDDDVCIVHVPSHWIEGLRSKGAGVDV
jgi:hypothetical protein